MNSFFRIRNRPPHSDGVQRRGHASPEPRRPCLSKRGNADILAVRSRADRVARMRSIPAQSRTPANSAGGTAHGLSMLSALQTCRSARKPRKRTAYLLCCQLAQIGPPLLLKKIRVHVAAAFLHPALVNLRVQGVDCWPAPTSWEVPASKSSAANSNGGVPLVEGRSQCPARCQMLFRKHALARLPRMEHL